MVAHPLYQTPKWLTARSTNAQTKVEKKRKYTPVKWGKNIIKRAKASGEAHRNHVGKEVIERRQLFVECRCKCLLKLNEEEKMLIIKEFNELGDHEKQNIYLRGCICTKDEDTIRRRNGLNNGPKKNRDSFVYTIKTIDFTIKLCKNAFCALHGIKESRLKRKVLNFTTSLSDKRGKHGHHKKLAERIRTAIREHINSFPARESHYSRSDNRTRIYLSSELNVSEMFRMFLDKHPDLKEFTKEWIYRDIFNYEFNISFGYPRTDICDTCEKFDADIKSAIANKKFDISENLKLEHNIHKRKGDAFSEQIREHKHLATDSLDVKVIAMDYQKNLPLPVTGIGQEYYKRQLGVHNLGIHDIGTGKASMYLYPENFARKGPNEVLSCLQHYINDIPATIKKLVIFTDNCFSQNKNRYMVAFLQDLCHSKFNDVSIHYPVPGHSRMPCDRDFGRIEKKKKKTDRFLKPSEIVNLIKKANVQNTWNIAYVEHPFTDNLQEDQNPVVKVKDFKSSLDKVIKSPDAISALRGISFEPFKAPLGRNSMTGPHTMPLHFLKRGKSFASLRVAIESSAAAYNVFLPIKKPKFDDIQSLLTHVHLPQDVTFYSSLTLETTEEVEEFE